MQKTKLRERIRDGWHAFRNGPTLVKFEHPVVHVSRSRVETFAVVREHTDILMFPGVPRITEWEAGLDIAKHIGQRLLDAGAIEIRRTPGSHPGYVRYQGRVRVVMPEKADGYRPDFSAVDEWPGLKEEPEEC